jgi:hypothetical protein
MTVPPCANRRDEVSLSFWAKAAYIMSVNVVGFTRNRGSSGGRMDLMLTPLGSIRLSDLTRPQTSGEPVNAHVVPQVTEIQPDFEAMQRMIVQTPEIPVGVPKTTRDGSR